MHKRQRQMHETDRHTRERDTMRDIHETYTPRERQNGRRQARKADMRQAQ